MIMRALSPQCVVHGAVYLAWCAVKNGDYEFHIHAGTVLRSSDMACVVCPVLVCTGPGGQCAVCFMLCRSRALMLSVQGRKWHVGWAQQVWREPAVGAAGTHSLVLCAWGWLKLQL